MPIRNKSIVAALLVLVFLCHGAPSHATSCWTAPHTFSAEVVTVPQMNVLSSNDTCNHTEINADGTIDRMLRLASNGSAAQNISTGATDLLSYAMPASKLGANDQAIYFEIWFNTAGNNNTKTITIQLGATSVTLFSQGAASNGINAMILGRITRKSATTQNVVGFVGTNALLLTPFNLTVTENLANALTLKFTATGGATGDVQADWQVFNLLR